MIVETLTADRTLCIGSGFCSLTAPHVFGAGTDDLVLVITQPDIADGAVSRAVTGCPVGALTLYEEQGEST